MSSTGHTADNRVAIGQVWQDWDVRYRGNGYQRFGRVVDLDETHATIAWEARVGDSPYARTVTRRVKLSRMKPTSTGYRLVSDA